MRVIRLVTLTLALLTGVASAADRTFQPGTLIIPMDLAYQDTGMFQAYGLVFQLLSQGVHVQWVIDPNKTYHVASCDSPTDPCPWDCAIEGSGVKCAYPTSSPDVTATTKVMWDDKGAVARGTTLGIHAYRGGPLVIDAADHDKALAIADIWNDQTKWAANPWAMRTVFHVTTVHEATVAFTGHVSKEMIAAPTIAVFADGNEAIATGYLRAAGIPQSNGSEFPTAKCGTANCGPGTANPDMLTEEAIMGDMGTCNAPNFDHRNGALFKNGQPGFCQIMSMHWNVTDRETVKCDNGNCPLTQAECTGQRFTYNGHEVVAEVREFLKGNTHLFAECQAVNAFEDTSPNTAWPHLDDPGRDGHFLTTTGTAPACPCSDINYQCVNNVCIAKDIREQNGGYEIAAQPTSATVKVLRPDIPYNQFDGMYGTTGGSEPAYNLSAFLGTTYKNNQQVTLLTGPNGPGDTDLWMTGYLDGTCDIGPILKPGQRAACQGKISYLGGHQYSPTVPVTSGSQSQGTRLFLNALFEADCVTGGPGGGGDTDGDGVPDATDPFPDDPNQCGDSDGDGCDDCSTGMFDLANDCAAGGGGPGGGCCQTGSGAGGAFVLGGFVFAMMLRRRRR
jgi:uncharacterized protein (TIGR03382 family)